MNKDKDKDQPDAGLTTALVTKEKAEKKLKGWNPFISKQERYEEAAELFTKAAISFKICKEWELAGNSHLRAAECKKLINSFETSSSLLEAASCYKNMKGISGKISSEGLNKAISCLRYAHSSALNDGKFLQAARYLKEVAELYEEDREVEKALASFKEAADLYEGENDLSQVIQCLTKVAHFLTTTSNFSDAIAIYEKLVSKCIDNNILKFKCNEYLFKAGLANLAMDDLVAAIRTLDGYNCMYISFQGSREERFLRELVESLEQYDVEAFTNAVVEFDSITPLDPAKTSILLAIKKLIWKKDQSSDLDISRHGSSGRISVSELDNISLNSSLTPAINKDVKNEEYLEDSDQDDEDNENDEDDEVKVKDEETGKDLEENKNKEKSEEQSDDIC